MSTLKLGAILPADAVIETGKPDLDIRGVTADSRAVKPGDIFVAIEGSKTDGSKFVAAALAAGAYRGSRATGAGDAVAGRRRLRAQSQCAARAGIDRGKILCAPAADHRGGDRHQRQDIRRRLHASDLDGARL